LLVFVEVLDELAEEGFLIDCLIVNFDSLLPGEPYAQRIDK
jgi:hypothetical protein